MGWCQVKTAYQPNVELTAKPLFLTVPFWSASRAEASDRASLAQAVDLTGGEPELGQHLVGVLAEQRRRRSDPGGRGRKLVRQADLRQRPEERVIDRPFHAPRLGLWLLERGEHVVHWACRNVGRVESREPVG